MKDYLLGMLGFVLVIILVAGIAIGGWNLYWWMNKASTNNTTTILQHSIAVNVGDIDAARNKISELTGLPDGPQKTAITTQVCALVASLTGNIPSDLASFQAQECS